MRKLKVFLWMFIIFLIQTVIVSRIRFYGAVPSIVMAYAVSVMLLEEEFNSAASTAVLCAVSAGALCGRNFYVMTLYIFFVSLIVFALRRKPLYIAGFLKAIFYTFVFSGALEILFFAMTNMTVTTDMLLYDALTTAAVNTVFVIATYPLLKRTMYKKEEKKLLIGDLV